MKLECFQHYITKLEASNQPVKWPASAGNSSFVKGFFSEKQISCCSFKVCSAINVSLFKRQWKCEWRSLRQSACDRQRQWTETHLLDEIAFTLWLPGSASRCGAKTQPFDSKLWLTGPQTMQANEIWLEIRWNLPSYIHEISVLSKVIRALTFVLL